ncbi:ribonuclease HII [Leptospira sp. 96542]|nr:ribonuclease HII [Leptospira sp. 96542]
MPDLVSLSFDEAGRGCLAGPVAIGCVSFSLSTLEKIKSGQILEGIRDSKILKLKDRLRLRKEILNIAQYHKVVFVSPRFIDRYNINNAIFYGIGRAIPTKEDPRFLFVDGNYKIKVTKQILGYHSIPKGDDLVPSISAASILAKTYRDEWMEEMDKRFPGYGFKNHKGYGTLEHRKNLEQLGISRIHRLSFCKFLRSSESDPSLFAE